MAYPALPTSEKTSTLDELARVKAGDHFFLGGYEYRARGDASEYFRNGFRNVSIDADRRHAGMRSGWELATVLEHERAEETPPAPSDAAPASHELDPESAYDETQTRDDIRNGDTLISGEVVGFLWEAWPVAVTAEPGQFHQIAEGSDPANLKNLPAGAIEAAVRAALEAGRTIAEEFAEIAERVGCEDAGEPELVPAEAAPIPRRIVSLPDDGSIVVDRKIVTGENGSRVIFDLDVATLLEHVCLAEVDRIEALIRRHRRLYYPEAIVPADAG